MEFINKVWLFLICALAMLNVNAQTDFVAPSKVDFIHYKAQLTPDFKTQKLTGLVNIEFIAKSENVKQLSFSTQYKNIFSVTAKNLNLSHQIKDENLVVSFKQPLKLNQSYNLAIEYDAAPERGMKFFDDHLFTVYHTRNWLVSHNEIADKASFELLVKHDAALVSVSNGQLKSQIMQTDNTVISHWLQNTPMPIYTFGFALGAFKEIKKQYKNAEVSYYFRDEALSNLNNKKITDIFIDVPDMITFFENKAGFPLPNNAYKYVIVDGYMAQEATGFSLVGEKYAHTVLEDKSENWFIAHELGHEWWGNSITCVNFSHFWLNEGLVQFLVAAYKQHLFGEEAYKKEITLFITRVDRAVKKGKVSPVAFKHQIKEHEINRSMAYSKGALVFYMLREKLGDKIFWQALKHYSVNNKQASVTTNDLKQAFEHISKQDLTDFFERWVYGNEIPKLSL
jgi:aminopeptidase N